MAEQTIAAGETVTIAAGGSDLAGPLNLDGTLNVDGTQNIGEETLTATAGAGADTTPTLTGETSLEAAAGAGSDGVVTASGEKDVSVTAGAGVFATAPESLVAAGGGGVATGAAFTARIDGSAGADATGTLDSAVPLRRETRLSIDEDRTSDFSTQGSGDVTDE